MDFFYLFFIVLSEFSIRKILVIQCLISLIHSVNLDNLEMSSGL